MLKGNIKFIGKVFKGLAVLLIVLVLIFPFNIMVALADPVPVEEVGANLEENTITAELRIPQNNSSVVSNTSSIVQMLGEIMAPVYQLATPGSNLTYDIYRYLMKHTESELGVDKDFFRRMQKKQTVPTVDIVFAPTNPKVGEKVTAFAVPRGFRNDKNKLYYTWYIVHNVKTGDESPDVEAGKKEAMRLVAAGNYDRDLFGEPQDDDRNRDAYNASFGGDDGVGKKTGSAANGDCEHCVCLQGMSMMGGEVTRGCFDDEGELLFSKLDEFDEMVLDRGFNSALLGRGVVNSDFISRCYRHNFGAQNGTADNYSGRDLIIKCQHAFGDGIGDNNFPSGEEESWGTNPEEPDTDGDGVVDEADLAGLGQDEFTWIYQEGDKVSVAVEGTSNTPINEGSTDRLRYKNKHWDGDEKNLDLSPTASPEQWYKDTRQECEDAKNDCLASTGNSLMYTPVADRLPSDGECVADYADCMKDLWEHQLKDDENDEDAFGKMTGYYKIMWAAPGVCGESNVDEAQNDWCDGEDDYGFQYLKLYDPVEQGKRLFEVSVNVSPKNPQFSEPDDGENDGKYSDSTDMIFASADVTGDISVNPDYLYYKWSVWRCEANDINTCHDVTEQVEFKSHKEGLGVREIGFYPTTGIFSGNRALLKIGVAVKRHKNSVMSSPGINGDYEKQYFSKNKKEHYHNEKEFPNKYAQIASKLLEVTKHDLKINLYMAEPDGNGGWKPALRICRTGLYKKICPVFPYEVIMAEVEGVGGAVSWKVNGHTIQPSLNKTVNTELNSSQVFFPIMGTEGSLGRVTVTAEQERQQGEWEDNNIIEERVFSIHKPMVAIVDAEEYAFGEALKRAYSGTNKVKRTLGDHQLWWVLSTDWQGPPFSVPDNSTIKTDIPIVIIPHYLGQVIDDMNISFKAYINQDFRFDTHIDSHQVDRSGARLIFRDILFSGVADKIDDLKIRTLMSFDNEHSNEYKRSLQQAFGIKPMDELVTDLDVKVKNITADKYHKITGSNAVVPNRTGWSKTTGKFFASTIQNAPEYLVFILRLAVSIVLVMGVSFGVVYFGEKRI